MRDFIEEWGWTIVLIGMVVGFIVFIGYRKLTKNNEKPVVEQVYEPEYHMIYFLDCDGEAFDSVKVEYRDFIIYQGSIEWYKGDLTNHHSGSYLVKELPDE
jgi:hypothetical protein